MLRRFCSSLHDPGGACFARPSGSCKPIVPSALALSNMAVIGRLATAAARYNGVVPARVLSLRVVIDPLASKTRTMWTRSVRTALERSETLSGCCARLTSAPCKSGEGEEGGG